jgi:phosphoglycolate phosphatase
VQLALFVMVIRAVFFDFDGTISDSMKVGYMSMIRALEDFGYDFDKGELRRLLGVKTKLILRGLGFSSRNARKVRSRFYEYFIGAIRSGDIEACVPLEPLWELRNQVPLFVISNSSSEFLKVAIKKLGLRKLFKGVYGSDDFDTKDKMFLKLFKKYGFKPTEVIYVGDRFSDVDFARDAGCLAVAIHNKCSISSLSSIKKEKPDYIIKNFSELLDIVEKLK